MATGMRFCDVRPHNEILEGRYPTSTAVSRRRRRSATQPT
jgi:hypothetical protein